MKCILCNQRKGKRICPAKNTTICTQCCGEKRVLEIDCPERCEYLKLGRNHEALLESERHYHAADPIEQERWSRILAEFEPLMVDLQTLIAVARRSDRDLKDADAAEALDCLIKTLQTEDRGVIYETTAENRRADNLRFQLSTLVASYRNPKDPGKPRVHLKDAIDCLVLLRTVVASHLRAGPSTLSFVDFLVRRLPRDILVGAAETSIIIPGR